MFVFQMWAEELMCIFDWYGILHLLCNLLWWMSDAEGKNWLIEMHIIVPEEDILVVD